MKAPGCPWEFWSGVIGLSTSLCLFDQESAVGFASDPSNSERAAIANYMIDLWTRFRHDNTGRRWRRSRANRTGPHDPGD
jgi:hypothetical protein